MLKHFNNIFDYVEQQKTAYQQAIPVAEGWEWSMFLHLKTSLYYLFGRLLTGNADDKPIKNIIRRIMKFRYAVEDIDVKDVDIYVDDPERQHLSFLVKKYHDEVFVVESKIDTVIDQIKKEKINFGGALVQNDNGIPKRVPLSQIAFCDQSNLMASPFGLKISMTPSELMDMKEKGWGDTKNGATMTVEELIAAMEYQRETNDPTKQSIKTPGKYVEIYQVWGTLPDSFVGGEEDKYTLQMHYVAFIKGEKDSNIGISLFSKEDKDRNRFKFIKQDDGDGLENRALGYGGVEELFEAQVWTNYSMIQKKNFLDSASKTLLKTTDPTLAAKHPNGLKDLDNMEVIEIEPGADLTQIDTFPRNYQLFEGAVREWDEYAQNVSFANAAMIGEESKAGVPFRSQERQYVQGKAPHMESLKEYARFIEEIYRDWVIPYISKQITSGTKFISELDRDEMEMVCGALVTQEANKFIKEQILSGQTVTDEMVAAIKQKVSDSFISGGNKKFIEILQGEFKNVPLKLKISVAGNKDLAGMVDRLSNVLTMMVKNPEGWKSMMAVPEMARVFRSMLEYSGISPTYAGKDRTADAPQPVAAQVPQQIAPVVK